MNWQTKQADRFQTLLNNCNVNVEMTDEQLTETQEDFENWEDESGEEIIQDTFNERLRMRVS